LAEAENIVPLSPKAASLTTRQIRVHDLRHVFASCLVMGGGDILTLQRILGHSTSQMTSHASAHLSPAHLAGAADRSLPVGPHGKRHNPAIQVGHVKNMVKHFGIEECAKGQIERLR
jgi:integrase